MADLFRDFAGIDYPILDSDAHVNEPPNLWTDRLPKRLQARAPRVESSDDGDLWVFDDGKARWPVGLTAAAGLSFFQFKPFGLSYDKMRPGSFDTAARLADMDADGIHAQVLYPSVTLNGARIYSSDRELQMLCVRAYNEWLLDFCKGSDGRLVPQAIIPTTGPEDAIAELEWAFKHGHRGAVISSFPNGSLDPKPEEDDRFWQAAAASGRPIGVHIGSFLRKGGSKGSTGREWTGLRFCGAAALTKAGGETLPVVCDLLFSGIFSQHPKLKLLLVEANIGWIPTLLEQADDMYMRYRWYTGAVEQQPEMPSQIFRRNFWATFMIDTVGMDLRHRMNLDHVMWSTDYPHSGTDWPNSRITIERNFKGLPAAEVKKMLHDNCAALYQLDVPDRLPGR